MSKKGVEMSMNLIIIAAIALLILVIISILVLRGGSNVNDGTGCKAKPGGECTTATSCPGDKIRLPGSNCPTSQICCIDNPVG